MKKIKVLAVLVVVATVFSWRLAGQPSDVSGTLSAELPPFMRSMASSTALQMPPMASWEGATPSTPSTAETALASGPALSRVSSPSPTVASGPVEVTVGIYLQNVNDIEIKSSAFMMDFYLWFLWEGDIDPTETFEFTNLLDSWSMTRQPVYVQPQDLPDGRRYQVLHIQGKFNRKFDLSQFPLDQQELVIELEDSRLQERELRYVADQRFSGFSPRISLPGWSILGFAARIEPIEYQTSFGNPFQERHEVYARFLYSLRIGRPTGAYLLRMLLPIVVILLTGFVVFVISPIYADTRINVALTVLLSMVALHLTVSSDLPQVGYLRLIDKIYNLSYLVTFATLLESAYAIHLNDVGRRESALRMDRWCLALVPALTFAGIVLLLVF